MATDHVELISQKSTVSFVALGDWGGLPIYPFRTLVEQAVAKQMSQLAHAHDTQFQLALGDNFYFNGVKDANDKRFRVKKKIIC
jgi:tartrate-resistant acid phosphatase type 5